MSEMTFLQLYKDAKKNPSPGAQFIKDIAEMTHRSEICVKKWLQGNTVPDINCQIILEQHFGIPRTTLFPIVLSKRNSNGI